MDSIRYLLLLHIRNSFLKIAVERYLAPPAGGLLLLLMQSMMTLDNFQAGFHRSFRVQGCALCVPLFSLRDSSSSCYLRIDVLLILSWSNPCVLRNAFSNMQYANIICKSAYNPTNSELMQLYSFRPVLPFHDFGPLSLCFTPPSSVGVCQDLVCPSSHRQSLSLLSSLFLLRPSCLLWSVSLLAGP